jgi:N-acetylglucosaminyldiphosphoundecaprenol N-acetyl-beta-D-mannosaminyltransferase
MAPNVGPDGKVVPSVKILGVRVNMVQITGVIDLMEHWIQSRDRCHIIALGGMHGVMESRRDLTFRTILNTADILAPDGFSLLWLARRRGFKLARRVSGTDLMSAFFRTAESNGYKMFFYGDTDHTLELLQNNLLENYPALKIAGAYSPPFRPLTEAEKVADIRMINESGADVLWVGLGSPKQERWMHENQDDLEVPVMSGVGAAFKFLSGQVRRAPPWLGNNGFEWLWRFAREPRRVWRRVVIDGPHFLFCVAFEKLDSRNRGKTK